MSKEKKVIDFIFSGGIKGKFFVNPYPLKSPVPNVYEITGFKEIDNGSGCIYDIKFLIEYLKYPDDIREISLYSIYRNKEASVDEITRAKESKLVMETQSSS